MVTFTWNLFSLSNLMEKMPEILGGKLKVS